MTKQARARAGASWCRAWALVLLAAALGCSGGDEEPAVAAADEWMAILDSGDVGRAWEETSLVFQKGVTKAEFERLVRDARAPLGEFVSRSVRSAQSARSLPGAPRGRYVVIQYDSRFSKRPTVESVTQMYEGDDWKISGYRSR